MNTNLSAPSWHTLGELELPANASTEESAYAWLMEILGPITLSPDFRGRVLKSAQESVGHALLPNAEDVLSHIHISVLVPRGDIPLGRSWGYFHIARLETRADGGDERHHAIDFYLYVEGE